VLKKFATESHNFRRLYRMVSSFLAPNMSEYTESSPPDLECQMEGHGTVAVFATHHMQCIEIVELSQHWIVAQGLWFSHTKDLADLLQDHP